MSVGFCGLSGVLWILVTPLCSSLLMFELLIEYFQFSNFQDVLHICFLKDKYVRNNSSTIRYFLVAIWQNIMTALFCVQMTKATKFVSRENSKIKFEIFLLNDGAKRNRIPTKVKFTTHTIRQLSNYRVIWCVKFWSF